MDDEILKTVESMLGKDIKIVDCEKTSSIREEEILLINGIPVQLEGDDGDAIKSALMTGQVPPCDLLNQLLYRAGILRQPVHLETSLSVKSSTIRKEEVTIARDGRILDERTSETQEDNIYTSSCQETWEPINKLGPLKNIIPIPLDRCLGNDGPAYLLATSKFPLPKAHQTANVKNSTSNLSKLSTVPPLSSSISSTSESSATSSAASSSAALSSNLTAGKSSIFTDCSASSLVTSPAFNVRPLEEIIDDDIVTSNIDRDISKKIIDSMSYDSGHDDLFNSFSQSNFLPTVTAATSPTVNSNSISSCYDFNSSDETDFINSKSLTSSPKISKDTFASKDFTMPTIFGTVASDQCPKDNINRRGFPQTVASCSSKTIDKVNQTKYQSHHPIISASFNIDHQQQQQPSSNQQKEQQQQYPHRQQHQQQYHHQQQHHHHPHHHQQSLDNDDNALVYRDGNLISGPLDTLIQHMVPTCDYYPDRSYLFAFLLSARLFIRPHELLAKICQLCEEQQNFNSCRSTIPNSDAVDQYYHQHSIDQLLVEKHYHPLKLNHSNNQQSSGSAAGAAAAVSEVTTDPLAGDSSDCCRKLRAFAQHFVQLLAEWIDTFPYDFRDERLMQHVRSMTRKCISIDGALRKNVSTILQNLLQRLTVLEKYEEFLLSLTRVGATGDSCHSSTNLITPASTSTATTTTATTTTTSTTTSLTTTNTKSSVLTIQNNLQSTGDNGQHHLNQQHSTAGPHTIVQSNSGAVSIDISELCSSPTLLAHQLTHIELERLSYIGPEEFVQAFAKENPHLEQSFSDIKKTRNLESYVQWFNRLSYLVATEIVKHPKKKQRVRIVEYWIETARECFNIGNFNSLMAIIAGLNMSPISRLKKTWAKVQSAKFSVLEHQMDPSSNFNSYRSTLKAAMWRSAGATDERERIVIPFFSLLVKDLYFLNEGCSNKLSNGHINFEKFWQLAKQVTEFIAWKQVTCPFEKLPKVIMFLQTNNVLNENTLAMASFECEPPDNNHEKDRYKSLKSEQHHQQHHNHHHQ